MSSGDRRLTPAALQSFRLTKHQVVNEKSTKDGLSPILAASTNGHLDVVRCLVKNSANINDTNPEGQTPLILAAKNGFQPLLRLLVNYGAKLDIQDAKGRTALMHALESGCLDLAKCLLDAGASQKPADRDGKTALLVAAECGHMSIVEHLLMESASGDLNARDRQGRTVLMMLARAGRAWPIYKYFSGSHLSTIINERDATDRTPLLHAAEAGKFSMGGRLVGWGADTTAVTSDGQTTVMLACQRPQLYCASDDADFDAAASDGPRPKSWSQETFITDMLERGVALDAVDRRGRTALFYAAEFAQLELVCQLLSLQANLLKPGRKDGKGNTVLHAAARMGREEVVLHLLSLPELADLIDEPNSDGDVPLRLAVMSKCLRTVQALMEGGASLKNANCCREPPLLCLASECGAEEIVAFLLDRGFDPDSADSDGVTALMAATRSDHINIVERLLKASANVNLFSKKGFTALTLAVQSINIGMCQLLLNRKANPNLLPDCNSDCKTLASIAATLDNCVMINFLSENGVDIFLTDLQGRNSLYYSVLLNRINSLKLLLKWADLADLNKLYPYDGQRHTLLSMATERGSYDVVELLLAAQPTVEIKSSLGESALHIACRRQDIRLAELLISYAIRRDCPRDSDQLTPLMIASKLGSKEIVRALCIHGADVNKRTPDGYTALILSIQGNEVPVDRVPLISTLLDYNATFDSADDRRLLGDEVWNLLSTLGAARATRDNISGLAGSPPVQAPQAKDQSKLKQQQQQPPGSSMTVEDRLKMKLKSKRLQLPLPTSGTPKAKQQQQKQQQQKQQQQQQQVNKNETFAVRSSKIREESRRTVDLAEQNLWRLASMLKKHVETSALADPTQGACFQAVEMKNREISVLYRKPFLLSYVELSQSKLLRDFSSRMDEIRRVIVLKFEEKLDAMCRRRPQPATSAKSGKVGSEPDTTVAEAPARRRRKCRVHRRVLYQLKCDSKAAKPNQGLRPVLVKRLDVLRVSGGEKAGRDERRTWRLPSFWERARLSALARRHLLPLLRRLASFADVTEAQAMARLSPVRLAGLAVAVDDATVQWMPLPGLSEKTIVAGGEKSRRSGDTQAAAAAAKRRTRRSARLKRLLAGLAFDGSRCSVLVRGGRRPPDVMLAMDLDDRERQVDLSCAIEPIQLQSRMPNVTTAIAKLSVDTTGCLWDPRELRALSDAFAAGPGNRDWTTWQRLQCLEALTRRQTYHLLEPNVTGRPQELDSVALHPALATKLAAMVLHTKLGRSTDAATSCVFHGDDVLVRQQQASQKDLKPLLGLLGHDRIKLVEILRLN